jgi:hypothetical protein
VFPLLLILIIVGLSLGVLLLVGGRYVQGYIYTEPSPYLRWGAPIAAAILFLFYTIWCVAVALPAPSGEDATYHILWSFSPTVNQFREPVKDLWAVRKGGAKEHYVLKKKVAFAGHARPQYRSADTDKPWKYGSGVEAIVIQPGGADLKYLPAAPDNSWIERGKYNEFVSSDGWVIRETDEGPSDNPEKSRWGRLVIFVLLHALHLGLWFACLWLLLRFQWGHALVAALILWLFLSILVVPMLVGYAVDVSRARQSAAVQK